MGEQFGGGREGSTSNAGTNHCLFGCIDVRG